MIQKLQLIDNQEMGGDSQSNETLILCQHISINAVTVT